MSQSPSQRFNGQKRKVFLVDAEPISRQGVAALVNGEQDLTVCGEADDPTQVEHMVATTAPHVVVLDIGMQDITGLDLIRRLTEKQPHVPLLVLSRHDEMVYAERVLKAGARGYVMKTAPVKLIKFAIRHVLDGEMFLSKRASRQILSQLVRPQTSTDAPTLSRLSDRELEVFELIGKGYTTNEIATSLSRSIKTVDAHREHIKRKLGLHNSTELTQHAIRWTLAGETSAAGG